MASSSQNPFEESLDDTFDQYFDQYVDQTLENLTVGNQEEARKQRKNELISKEIVKKGIFIYGMIISVKLQRILKISSDDILE